MSNNLFNLEFYNGKRVLLTGHTGFKGTWMCCVLKEMGAEELYEIYKSAYQRFFEKWGIKFEDMPDYMPGLKTISAKFREAFKSAIVDGHVDALG